jgi:hypothetical protein
MRDATINVYANTIRFETIPVFVQIVTAAKSNMGRSERRR